VDASIRHHSPARAQDWTTAVLVLWFTAALCGSAYGVFQAAGGPPVMIGAAAALPLVALALAAAGLPALRRHLLAVDPRALVLVHITRVGGMTFLILHRHALLPAAFALSAGWGDVFIGATAPLVAAATFGAFTRATTRRWVVAWHLLGLLDLVTAVGLAVLTSTLPAHVLGGAEAMRLMGGFPLSLIPTFFVPLLAILHAISLAQLRAAATAAATGRTNAPAPADQPEPAAAVAV